MKRNKFSLLLFALAAVAFTGCEHEDVEEHHFSNKLYFTTTPITDDLLIKDDVVEATRSISSRLAMPAEQDITVTVEAQPTMAAQYNMIYGDDAFALNAKYFDIPEKTFTIKKGDIAADDIVVNFKNTNELNSKLRYVLPVTIADAEGMSVLDSRRTVYFIFKGAALINVVANISEMYFPVNWSSTASALVSGMKTITIEALLRSENWVAGRDNALSTLIGIEGSFLIRIGDGDRPRDQLQLVEPNGNKWPNPNAAPALPVNEWVHIAIVWDAATGERLYYQNGKLVASSTSGASGTASLKTSCNIGKSYDTSRWLPADISELRVWNIQRTAQEIADNPYYVNPNTPGLVAYWRFNEGEGNVIKDATANATNLTGSSTPKWVPVELPALK